MVWFVWLCGGVRASKRTWKYLERIWRSLEGLKTFPVNLEVQRKSGISQAGPAAFLLSVQLIFEPIFFLLGFLRRGVELSEYVASNDEEKYISVLHICRAYLCMHTARTQSSILESTASPDTDLLIFLLYFVSQLVPNLRIYNLTKDLCLRLQNLAARRHLFLPHKPNPWLNCCLQCRWKYSGKQTQKATVQSSSYLKICIDINNFIILTHKNSW